jgi:hypothetical protein
MSTPYYTPSGDPADSLTKEEQEIFDLLVVQDNFVKLHANVARKFLMVSFKQRLLIYVLILQLPTI